MDISAKSKKEIGALGEKIAAEYLRRQGMKFIDKNFARKTGEIDLIVREGDTLHFVEVKTIECDTFPSGDPKDEYDPSINIHEAKVRKIARTGEWYVMQKNWEGDWQVDAVLVWLRRRDGMARVRYLPQIV
ncbi:MAG: YraN family protein [bacterium]|nr:YraN family protein [bacterium]